MANKRTWLSILIAAVAIVVVFCIALVGGSVYWFYRHINTQYTSSENAVDELTRERARFAGQQPLVEMRPGADPVVRRTSSPSTRGPVTNLHMLGYDPDKGRLIRATFPFWALRLAPSSAFSVTSEDSLMFGTLRVTLDDLDRHGPGLVLTVDDVPVRGVHALIWTD